MYCEDDNVLSNSMIKSQQVPFDEVWDVLEECGDDWTECVFGRGGVESDAMA